MQSLRSLAAILLKHDSVVAVGTSEVDTLAVGKCNMLGCAHLFRFCTGGVPEQPQDGVTAANLTGSRLKTDNMAGGSYFGSLPAVK